MPNLYNDQSIPALTWRGGTKDGQFSLKRMHDESFKVVNQSRTGKLLHTPNTVVGLRNGIPLGQDQDYKYNQLIDMNPYPMGKNPFLSDSVEDMYPKTYGQANPMGGTNGTILNVSSITGTPLAMALDDGTELLQRIHTEAFRIDPKNPLSGEFALAAFLKNQTNPETGPMSDYMRMGLAQDAEDAYVLNQQLAAGFLREEFNNIPAKMREKLLERSNLNKTNQDIRSTEDRLKQTDPTGVLTQSEEGNLIEKQIKQEKEQLFHAPKGGNDAFQAESKTDGNSDGGSDDGDDDQGPGRGGGKTPVRNPHDHLTDYERARRSSAEMGHDALNDFWDAQIGYDPSEETLEPVQKSWTPSGIMSGLANAWREVSPWNVEPEPRYGTPFDEKKKPPLELGVPLPQVPQHFQPQPRPMIFM
jgi:hypothetical protein